MTVSGNGSDSEDRFAFLDDRPRIDAETFLLGDGQGFPGHRRLIHTDLTAQDHAIQRNDAAAADDDPLSDFHVHDRNEYFSVIPDRPDPIDIESEGAGEVIFGFLSRPVFQDLAESQQKHDRRCGIVITGSDRSTDRRRIQNGDFHFSFEQGSQSFPDKSYGLQQADQIAYRDRQKQRGGSPFCNMPEDLFLSLSCENTSALNVFSDQIIGKAIQPFQDFIPAVMIDQHITGPFIDFCPVDLFDLTEIMFKFVGFLDTHRVLRDVKAKITLAFMFQQETHQT